MSNDESFWEELLDEQDHIASLAELARKTLEAQRRTGELYIEMERQVGLKIRMQRIASNLSQAQLADRMTDYGFDLSQSTIAKIEGGKRPLRLAEVYALEHLLGLPYMTLVLAPHLSGNLDDDGLSLLRARLDRESDAKKVAMERIIASVELNSKLYAEADASILWLSHLISESAANSMGTGTPNGAT